jgi:hypothetical protein
MKIIDVIANPATHPPPAFYLRPERMEVRSLARSNSTPFVRATHKSALSDREIQYPAARVPHNTPKPFFCKAKRLFYCQF